MPRSKPQLIFKIVMLKSVICSCACVLGASFYCQSTRDRDTLLSLVRPSLQNHIIGSPLSQVKAIPQQTDFIYLPADDLLKLTEET